MKQLTNAFLLRYFNGYPEVTTFTEGIGLNFPISGKASRIWLTDSDGYRVVDPNIIIQEVSGSSVSGDWNLLGSYNTTLTPGAYTLHVISVEASAHIPVNRTVIKFVGYQNQL